MMGQGSLEPGRSIPVGAEDLATGAGREGLVAADLGTRSRVDNTNVQTGGDAERRVRRFVRPTLSRALVDTGPNPAHGEVGHPGQRNINWGKAGRMRWKGKRPSVRGVAMNPVDHPHGGGEGKTSGGRHPVNPAGKPEGRTRRRKASDALIVRRRKTNKKR